MTGWNIERSEKLYNIAHWGAGYFAVNNQGQLVVRPDGNDASGEVILSEVVARAREHDLTLPILVRFSGILHHRFQSLRQAFGDAMAQYDCKSVYTAVYPIKVNQQLSVVEEILASGKQGLGLEAGSKPELMAVLSLSSDSGGIVVCNGYKDREYIRLALIGAALGHRVHVVIEKLSELEMIVGEAEAMGIDPILGIRLRLSSLGAGKWQNTGGEKSKFGLSASEVLRVIEYLRSKNMLQHLKMMHFHMGSQISNVRDIQAGMKEGARYYAELRSMGANIETINVGGGLGVDYEGTRSRSYCSINYSLQEYANNIVHAIWEVCEAKELPFPNLVSESGRAMTAHHAMLVTNVLEVERVPEGDDVASDNTAPLIVQELQELLDDFAKWSPTEIYHDAVYRMGEIQGMFSLGVIGLRERAKAERLFSAISWRVMQALNTDNPRHRQLAEEIRDKLADKYFCNFSVFQSLPDSWAIDQVFPLVPLQRLDEKPQRHATIEDITCDSDGRIDSFPQSDGLRSTLPLHELRDNETYLIGIFLLGAYQEILGDMHNLFGDTDSLHVELNGKDGFEIARALRGDSTDHVLELVHFKPEAMRAAYRRRIEAKIPDKERQAQYLQELEAGLTGYTYLED